MPRNHFFLHYIPLAKEQALLLFSFFRLFPIQSEGLCHRVALLCPSTSTLPPLLSSSDKRPITTWPPLTTKPFPLPAKQVDSFKLRIPPQLILTHMVRFLPLTWASHCTRPYQLSITISSPPYQKAHGYLATISSRNNFFTNKLAFTLPAINKAADGAALSYMQWNCKLLWGPQGWRFPPPRK